MKLTFEEYHDKVTGCYFGKNIGGTLGAPFECYRGVYDIDRFMQDVSSPVPNDDIDLQLVWLSAVEHEGRKIDSQILAEYWNNYVSSVISEYGTGKNNFNMGIMPPLSGRMRNENRDSNGAWIRTEIWACLAAGNPALAANYAYYDATVDHADEGLYAAIFTSTIQAAAFFENDRYRLIDIGLSYIPDNCGVRTAVNLMLECYKKGLTWQDARIELFKAVPSSFGEICGVWQGNAEVSVCKECPKQEIDVNIPKARRGYDAPWSIGAILIGWLYGEGDFGKSVCLATNCGEDTDCTAGTLGAILGIILGAKAMPEKWLKGCSDKIAICTLRPDCVLNVPKTLGELVDRIVRQTPVILEGRCNFDKEGVKNYEIEAVNCLSYKKGAFDAFRQEDPKELIAEHSSTVRRHFYLYTALLQFDESLVKISDGASKKLKITFLNQLFYPQYLTVRFIEIPSDWEVKNGEERVVGLEQWHGGRNDNYFEMEFTPKNLKKGRYTIIMEISTNGRMTKNYIPLTFINGAC